MALLWSVLEGRKNMARSTSKAAVRYAATDVYCNFALTVRKSHGRSKASSRANIKQSGTGRKER